MINISREYTNSLRGLSALIIIVFHLGMAWNFPRIINVWGGIGVAIFLFLSGYGMHESFQRNGLSSFWSKRIRRIAIPYWIVTTVLFLWRGLDTWPAYLRAIFFIESELWFIVCIAKWYLIFWIIMRFFGKYADILLILSGVLTLLFAQHYESEQAFSFVSGVFLSKYYGKIATTDNLKILLVATVLLLFGIFIMAVKALPSVQMMKETVFFHALLMGVKLPIGISIAMFFYLLPRLQKSLLLRLSGLASLELYMVHAPLVNWTSHHVWHLFIFSLLVPVLSFLFYQLNQIIYKR